MVQKKTTLALFLLVLASLFGTPSHAYVGLCCGKCGGNMPMNTPGPGIPETHEFRFKVSPSYMRMEGLRDGTDSVPVDSILGMPSMGKFMAAPTSMDMTMLNASMGYSFSKRFFAGLMLMWKDNRMDMQFNNMMQMMTGQSGFTMESSGLADTMLMAKYLISADDPLIPTRQSSLFFGLSLPTGSIDERNTTHPIPIRQQELVPYGMQLGSGTVDPFLGILYGGSHSPYWWGVNAIYKARLYDNKREYRLGNEFRVDGWGMYQFASSWLVQAQLNAHYQDSISGIMDESASGASGRVIPGNSNSPFATPLWDPNNYGGTQLFTTLGVQWQPAQLHILDFQFSLPLYRDLNGPQLETDYRVMLTWFYELPTSRSVRYTGRQPSGESQLGF